MSAAGLAAPSYLIAALLTHQPTYPPTDPPTRHLSDCCAILCMRFSCERRLVFAPWMGSFILENTASRLKSRKQVLLE